MIMVKAGATLVRRRAIVEGAGRSLMFINMMSKVLGDLVLFVRAIVSHRRPRGLEREQAQHNKHEEASHG